MFSERSSEVTEKVVDTYGTSDFLLSVSGKVSEKVMNIMDELMSTLQGESKTL